MCVCNTYHTDVKGVEQVKGQRSDQIHKEPGGGVVDADGAGIVHHLTGRAHVSRSEVQHDICRTSRKRITHQCYQENMHVRCRVSELSWCVKKRNKKITGF